MPSIKFPLHPTHYSGADNNEDLQDIRRRFCSKIFKKADNFSNSESLCCSDASNQVLTQSDLWFGRGCEMDFKVLYGYAIWHHVLTPKLMLHVYTMAAVLAI